MWIQTQNKQRIINSDQIIDIFIDKTGKIIYAETTRDGDFFTLGEFKDRDTCLKVLESMGVILGIVNEIQCTAIPLGGDVDAWCNEVKEFVQAFVIHGLLK